MKRILMLATLTGLSLVSAILQGQPQGRGGGRAFPPGETVLGKVTSASKDSLVVAPLAGGDAVTVKVSDITRVTKDRQPIKLTDIKMNDVVFVRGQLSGGTMAAAMVGVVNPEMVQRIRQGGGIGRGNGGGEGTGGFNRDDLGKKFIAGEVKAINETKLTIARPDGQSQDIEVDENTSFKRGNESITLPDIHVGDFVRGPGELKDTIFIAKELAVGRPMRMRTGESGGGAQQNLPGNPSADKPSTPAPPQN
ncbi:MAG TPA: DUF5666 domain-containing protein [Candidatus Angelobacter sp.]